MAGFARRPLALFVCCLIAGLMAGRADAETDRLVLADDDAPLKLRLERKFNVLGKTKKAPRPEVGTPYPVAPGNTDTLPLFIVADRLQGRVEEVAEATGSVELRKAGAQVFGEAMTYWPLDDEVDATSSGRVRFLQDGAEFSTPHLRLKLSEQVGFADRADYQIVREVTNRFYVPTQPVVQAASSNAVTAGAPMMMNVPSSYGLPTETAATRPSLAAGATERAEFEGENQFRLFDATYSTCKPGQTDWYLNASELYLDYDREVGSARHASLWFKDVPIFYMPAATFPLNQQRQSGFMHPVSAFSSVDGLDLTVPYYWNIAPNYDATFFPRYMAKRGTQLGIEARYLDYNFSGTTRAAYLPNDKLDNDSSRWMYQIQHQQNLGIGVSAAVNWNAVSDDFYWQDLSSRLTQTTQVQLPQQVTFNYVPTPGFISNVIFQRFQTLQTDPSQPVGIPYFFEPQINVVGFKPDVLKTDFTLIGQLTRFTNTTPGLVDGDRMVVYPQFALPYVHPAFYVTPKAGVHVTQYSLNDQVPGLPGSINRTLPILSVDSGVTFERETSLAGRDFIHTLEPRLYYVYIPYKDQSNIPVFDTALSDFNFTQIFSENIFSGYDRINNANQLTASVATRMLDAGTGVERFKAMVGQRYYFTPQQVTLPGQVPGQEGYSSVVAAANGLIFPKTYADAAVEYNFRDNLTDRFSIGMRFQPELGKVLSAGYRYNRDQTTQDTLVSQYDIAGQWPLTDRLHAVGRYNYSVQNSQLLEAIGGLEYNAGCWALRAVVQRLEAIAGAPNTTLFLQLELNDFASVGTNPINLLRRSIPGYGKVNELTTSGNMLTTQ